MGWVWLCTILPNVPLIPSVFLSALSALSVSAPDHFQEAAEPSLFHLLDIFIYFASIAELELRKLRWGCCSSRVIGHAPAVGALQFKKLKLTSSLRFDLMCLKHNVRKVKDEVFFKQLPGLFSGDRMKPGWKTKLKKASFAQFKTQKR